MKEALIERDLEKSAPTLSACLGIVDDLRVVREEEADSFAGFFGGLSRG
jgi:hypothetical protein